MGRRSPAEVNLAAEARAVEAGHRARVQDGGWVKVTSDTHGGIGKFYRVEYKAHVDGSVSFSCRPGGARAFEDDHLAASASPGVTPCMHAALAARRLERAGLARVDGDGLWRLPDRLLRELHERLAARRPADPFEGLPR